MKHIKVSLILICILSSIIHTQTIETIANKPCQMGTEFYLSFPTTDEINGGTYLYLLISCPVKSKIRVEIEKSNFVFDAVTVPNIPLRVDLSPGLAQVFQKKQEGAPPPDAIYPGAGIHVTSEFPIALYGVNATSYTGDSFMVLPIETLGTEYIIGTAPDCSWLSSTFNIPAEVNIVAVQNNTQVQIKIGGTLNVKTSGGLTFGQTKTLTLNKGDVYAISTDGKSPDADITGTKIVSNNPIAVISGNYCALIPTGMYFAGYVAEMQIPTYAWGKVNLIPRFTNRKYSYYLKVISKDGNTNVQQNGNYIKTLLTSGGADGSAYMYRRATTDGNVVSMYSGDKPINSTVYNTGEADDGVYPNDPFQMNVVPFEQFSTLMYFSSPITKGISQFTEYMGVVFPLTENNTIPDDLEFATLTDDGNTKWRKFSAVFGQAISSADIFYGNSIKYGFKEVRALGPGTYALRCSKPIMVYCYGVRPDDAYGLAPVSMMYDITKKQDTVKPKFTFNKTDSSAEGIATDLPNVDSVRSNMCKVFLNYGSYNIQFDSPQNASIGKPSLHWKVGVIDTFAPAVSVTKPSIIKSVDKTICETDTIILSCKGEFVSYLWSNGDTSKSIKIYPTIHGTYQYWVRTVDGNRNYSYSDTLIIVVEDKPLKPEIIRTENKLSVELLPQCKYSWYKDGVELKEIASNTFTIHETGVYQVKVVNIVNGCWSLSEAIYEVVIPTSVLMNNNSKQYFVVSPNPAQSYLKVVAEEDREYSVDILNVLGEVCVRSNIEKSAIPGNYSETVLNIEQLPQGKYLIKIRTPNGMFFLQTVIITR